MNPRRRGLLPLLADSAVALLAISAVFQLWVGVRTPVGLAAVTALDVFIERGAGLMAALPGFGSEFGVLAALAGLAWAGAIVLLGGSLAQRLQDWAPLLRVGTSLLALPAVLGLLEVILGGAGRAPVPFLFSVGAMATMLSHFAEARQPGPVLPGLRAEVFAAAAVGATVLGLRGAALGVPRFLDPLLGWLPDGPVTLRLGTLLCVGAATFASARLLDRGVPLLPSTRLPLLANLLALGHLAFLATVTSAPETLLQLGTCPDASSDVVVWDAADGWSSVSAAGERTAVAAAPERRALAFFHPAEAGEGALEVLAFPSRGRWLVGDGQGAWSVQEADGFWSLEQLVAGDEAPGADGDGLQDGADLTVLAVGDCRPTAAVAVPGVRVLACAGGGLALVDDTGVRRVLPRLAGIGALVALDDRRVAALPDDGRPWAALVDAQAGTVLRSWRVGGGHGGGGVTNTGDLLLPRFREGRLEQHRVADGAAVQLWSVGYGAGDVQAAGPVRYVAAPGAGLLSAVLGDEVHRRAVGPGVRELALIGDRLVFGGRCGLRSLDTRAWPPR